MNSEELAKYIEMTEGISKPWLLIQLRLKKLQENQSNISSAEYDSKLTELHQNLMDLGEWWIGIEDQVFKP